MQFCGFFRESNYKAIKVPIWTHWDELNRELDANEFLRHIKEEVVIEEDNPIGFTVEEDLVCYNGRLVLPMGLNCLSR